MITFKCVEASNLPALFSAIHVYTPSSCLSNWCAIRVPESASNFHPAEASNQDYKIVRKTQPSLSVAAFPSLSTQVYFGEGDPSAWHLNSAFPDSIP